MDHRELPNPGLEGSMDKLWPQMNLIAVDLVSWSSPFTSTNLVRASVARSFSRRVSSCLQRIVYVSKISVETFGPLSLLKYFPLVTALVPLSAGPNKSEAGETVSTEDINISSSYPTETEWFEVAEREESKESSFMPSVNVNAAGNGVQLSGMGKSWRSSHIQSYKIKLDPSKTLFEGLPTLLKL